MRNHVYYRHGASGGLEIADDVISTRLLLLGVSVTAFGSSLHLCLSAIGPESYNMRGSFSCHTSI